MTMEDDANLASTKTPRRPRWRGTAVAVGSLVVAGAGLFASTELHGVPSLHATPQAARAAIGASIVLADDAPPTDRPAATLAPASAGTLPAGSPFIGSGRLGPNKRQASCGSVADTELPEPSATIELGAWSGA